MTAFRAVLDTNVVIAAHRSSGPASPNREILATILECVDNQPWGGEANVHVSIANWVKSKDETLLPETRRLWFKVEPTTAMTART